MTMLAAVTTVDDLMAGLRLLATAGLPLPERMSASIAASDEEADRIITAAQQSLNALGIGWTYEDRRVPTLTVHMPGCTYILRHIRLGVGRTFMSTDRPLAG